MMQGTTPKHTFNIPFDTSFIQEVRVWYSQNDTLILTKSKTDCTLEDHSISVNLTQEDTLKFAPKTAVEIQIKVLTTGGDVLASVPMRVGVTKCLSNEVLI